MKVFEFAKELGLTPLGLMDKIREWELPVKNHMSELPDDVAIVIRSKLLSENKDTTNPKFRLRKRSGVTVKIEIEKNATPEHAFVNTVQVELLVLTKALKVFDGNNEEEVFKSLSLNKSKDAFGLMQLYFKKRGIGDLEMRVLKESQLVKVFHEIVSNVEECKDISDNKIHRPPPFWDAFFASIVNRLIDKEAAEKEFKKSLGENINSDVEYRRIISNKVKKMNVVLEDFDKNRTDYLESFFQRTNLILAS